MKLAYVVILLLVFGTYGLAAMADLAPFDPESQKRYPRLEIREAQREERARIDKHFNDFHFLKPLPPKSEPSFITNPDQPAPRQGQTAREKAKATTRTTDTHDVKPATAPGQKPTAKNASSQHSKSK